MDSIAFGMVFTRGRRIIADGVVNIESITKAVADSMSLPDVSK